MGDLIYMEGTTRLDIPADRVLEGASGKLQKVVIVGYAEDGSEYFASSVADGGEVTWMLERAKLKLLRMGDPE